MTLTCPLNRDDKDWLIAQVREVAQTEIMPRFRHLSADQIASKSAPDDLVTEADLRSEDCLTGRISARFPDALVIGEEAVAANPAVLADLAGAELAFVLDPVDGTWNFAHGLAVFGVILAVTQFGKPVFGLLYDPVLQDWVEASTGQGAMFQNRAIPPSKGATPPTGYIPLFLFTKEQQHQLAATFPEFRRVLSLRCSCHEYRMLAQGHVDFCVSAKLNPWDHLAGALAVQEAGGVARMLDGRDYDAHISDGVLICAVDEPTWADVAARIAFLQS